jgi:transcriptional regulator with XRE-family HTH domain
MVTKKTYCKSTGLPTINKGRIFAKCGKINFKSGRKSVGGIILHSNPLLMNFGKALKTIRLLQGLSQKEAASLLHMDDRTLRNIEADKTRITAEQVEQFASIYRVDITLIYEMAKEQVPFQNIVHEAKRDGIVVNQDADLGKGLVDHFLSRLEILEASVKELERS